jgi:hypothetical protein
VVALDRPKSTGVHKTIRGSGEGVSSDLTVAHLAVKMPLNAHRIESIRAAAPLPAMA